MRESISESELITLARHALTDSTTPLRIESCHAKRRPDGTIVGYVATVQVDPKLGVPALEPAGTPRWGASRVLVIHLDEHGNPIRRSWGPFIGVASVYLLLCAIVGLYVFVRGGAGPDDLFGGVAYNALTFPTSLLVAVWRAQSTAILVAAPLVNVGVATLVYGALARRHRV